MKVTIVGAGNVGSTCADAIAYKRIASEVYWRKKPQRKGS